MRFNLPDDLYVPKRLYKQGLTQYEPDTLACFLAALALSPGAVLDVGANVGIYAALASIVAEGPVLAFEPAPRLVAAARQLAADNDLSYEVLPVALGRQRSVETLYLSATTDSSNSLREGFRESNQQLAVKVETLDSVVRRRRLRPGVVKVDTESTEPDVLHGAARTIRRHRPWILCEVLHDRCEQRLMEVMRPHGYTWYRIDEQLPYREQTTISGDPSYRHLMWLFAPAPTGDEFWNAVRRWRREIAECRPR